MQIMIYYFWDAFIYATIMEIFPVFSFWFIFLILVQSHSRDMQPVLISSLSLFYPPKKETKMLPLSLKIQHLTLNFPPSKMKYTFHSESSFFYSVCTFWKNGCVQIQKIPNCLFSVQVDVLMVAFSILDISKVSF